jgi:hypothetical protein
MQISYLKAALPGVILLTLTACIDDKYDLSDIDTLSQVRVTDLVLPVNVDVITLDDMIDIDEDDQFQKVKDINGKEFYAFLESGEFSSDAIFVDKVSASAPKLNPTTSEIYSSDQGEISGFDFDPIDYEITEMSNDCTFSANNVDESITALTSAKTNDVTIKITLDAKGMSSFAKSMKFTNLTFQLLKGMVTKDVTGKYDAQSGIWTIDSYETTGTTATFSITVTGFDFVAAGAVLDTEAHTFTLPGKVSVQSGTLTLTPKQGAVLSRSITFNANYSIDNMVIKSFCGRMHYTLDGMDLDPMEISNIPDFLAGDDSNLFLANPQIYMTVNNPVADSGLKCRTGLTLTAQRPSKKNIPDFSYSADEPVTIGCDHGVDGPYNYVLAPSPGTADINIIDKKYQTNLTPITFPGLKYIVGIPEEYNTGSLPEYIAIDLADPEIIENDVVDFELGRNISGIKGSYDFVAPIALSAGSSVVYTKSDNGWNDDTVDKITIDKLSATANVTNETDLDVVIRAYPIDKRGRRIEGVTITSSRVPANAVDAPITVTMEGTITHLDGIQVYATLVPGEDDAEEAIAPDQKITLKNVRATVSGNVTKEL